MKISFTDKILESDHPVFIVSNKASKIDSSISSVDRELINILKEFMKNIKDSSSIFTTLSYRKKSNISYFTIAKCGIKIGSSEKLEFSGQLLSYLERCKIKNTSIFFLEDKNFKITEYVNEIICGLFLKDYRFEKYKTISKKDNKVSNLKLATKISSSQKKDLEKQIRSLKGIFLTRDLVSEPANVLYPEKFVDYCNVMKKEGIKIEVFDEKIEVNGYECSSWCSSRLRKAGKSYGI